MRLLDGGTVLATQPDAGRASVCFANLCVLSGGRWLVACRAAATKTAVDFQETILTWSDDRGATWHEPISPFRPPAVGGRPGHFRAGAATALGGDRVLIVLYWVDASVPGRPFFNPLTEGLLDSRLFIAESTDGGASWDEPRRVDTGPFTMPTPFTGPALLLPNGDWAITFETQKAYDDPGVWHQQAVMLFSHDRGRTWPDHAIIADDPGCHRFYWDNRVRPMPDGSLLALFWTFDRDANAYLPIHASRSADSGRTWSAPQPVGVDQQPSPPVGFPDGRVAMAFVNRDAAPAIRLRLSGDGGRTWPAATELELAAAGQATSAGTTLDAAWDAMEHFALGLPDTAPLPGNQLLVTWYEGPHPDRTGIRYARVALD